MAFQRIVLKARYIKCLKDLWHVNNISTEFSPRFLHYLSGPCTVHMLTQNGTNTSNLNYFLKENPSRYLHLTPYHEAGHSKWSNIKHIKGAQDKARGEKTSALARKIQLTLTKNPEKNPKLNSELASLIKWARSNNIPNDVIDRTVERTVKLRDPANLTVFDGRGPSNIAIVMECIALKPNHTKGLLQGVVKKYGFNLNTSAADLFEHRGIVEAEVPESELATAQNDPDNFPLDKYIDIAIEAGAEDVTLQSDPERPYLEFTCAPQDCDKVQANVEKGGIVVTSSERNYIPSMLVTASNEYLQSLEILKNKLDIHPDVIKYYFNVVPES